MNAPLERYAVPTVNEETVRLIASRFDLPLELLAERLPDVGINNAIFTLGENLILRVARNDPEIFASVRGRGSAGRTAARSPRRAARSPNRGHHARTPRLR